MVEGHVHRGKDHAWPMVICVGGIARADLGSPLATLVVASGPEVEFVAKTLVGRILDELDVKSLAALCKNRRLRPRRRKRDAYLRSLRSSFGGRPDDLLNTIIYLREREEIEQTVEHVARGLGLLEEEELVTRILESGGWERILDDSADEPEEAPDEAPAAEATDPKGEVVVGSDVETVRRWLVEAGVISAPDSRSQMAGGRLDQGDLSDWMAARTSRGGQSRRLLAMADKEFSVLRGTAAAAPPWSDDIVEALRSVSANPKDIKKVLHTFPVSTAWASPDYLGFYAPFHFYEKEKWGIWLHADGLIEQAERSYRDYEFPLWPRKVLLGLHMVDVFHHEFYHHLVEAAASFVEVLQAPARGARGVYQAYRRACGEALGTDGEPLEEALANAYAHNAFGFLARVNKRSLSLAAKFFQALVRSQWRGEGPGYRDAERYVPNKHIEGNTRLMSRMVGDFLHDTPMGVVAKHLMPGGHAALASKPDIPTYLYGTPSAIRELLEQYPAPVEFYSALKSPWDTTVVDKALNEFLRSAEEWP